MPRNWLLEPFLVPRADEAIGISIRVSTAIVVMVLFDNRIGKIPK